jgi:hypothetical protein
MKTFIVGRKASILSKLRKKSQLVVDFKEKP